jgi:hypothetical protein
VPLGKTVHERPEADALHDAPHAQVRPLHHDGRSHAAKAAPPAAPPQPSKP